MDYLGFIKLDMQLYNHFANHKSAVACAFRRVFGFDLGKAALMLRWLKGWKIELPPQPQHDPDEDG